MLTASTRNSTQPDLTSTISAIDVDEIRHQGALVDRKVVIQLQCGHRHFLSVRLDAALPKVGDPSSYRCLPCTLSARLDHHEIEAK